MRLFVGSLCASLLSWMSVSQVLADQQGFVALKGHGGPVMALAADPRGSKALGGADRLASASFDNTAALWSPQHQDGQDQDGQDQDGQGGAAQVPRWLEQHNAAVTALAFAPDGTLFSGGDDFAIWHWNASGAQHVGDHRGKIRALAVSPDGGWLASGSWDGTLALWPLGGGAPKVIDLGSGVNDVAFDAQGVVFAATMAGRILRIAADEPPQVLAEQGFGINRLVVQDGWLAYGAVDGATRVINAATGADLADFTLDRRPILALAYHGMSAQLAVGDGQGYIMVIDTEDWRITRDFRAMREGPVWALAYSGDGRRIWAGGLDAVIYGWPVELLGSFDPVGETRAFLADPDTVSNGERQFLRKCSICHALEEDGSRKAGPHLEGLFGRRAGSLPQYRYSSTLDRAAIIWNDDTIDALFDLGPDHYIPGSKMPMQRITRAGDRADLIAFLKEATRREETR